MTKNKGKKIDIDVDVSDLVYPLRLSFPVIGVETFETSRAGLLFKKAAEAISKPFKVVPFKSLPTIQTFKKFLSEAKTNTDLILFDPYFMDRMAVNPEVLPALRSSITALENLGINYIIVGKDVPNEEFVYFVDLPKITKEETMSILLRCEENVSSIKFQKQKEIFSQTEREVLVNTSIGISFTQLKNVFTLASALKIKNQEFLPAVIKEKARILRESGIEVLESLQLEDAGGLENLKSFLIQREKGWQKGLPAKGILLAGVPGGGKTLTAKVTAGIFKTSLVRLDISRFYNKKLGETEKLFSRALKTVDSIAPVVVLIDEIEKFFGMGQNDHEVSKRLLGTFLYWLQERKEKVFLIATANRVNQLPPELMRAGRWDKSFFIDLPNASEREKIFEIHLKKNNLDPEKFDLKKLAQEADNYTGAEIEQAVIDSLYISNEEDKDTEMKHVLKAVKEITPTAQTRKEEIAEIRKLSEYGFYPASVADKKEEIEENTYHRKISVL